MSHIDRRSFLATSAAVAGALFPFSSRRTRAAPQGSGGPVVISSANGIRAVTRTMDELVKGEDPAGAVVAGVTIVEDDPNDMTVGLGGLPNEDGVVQLDASVMHGPMHKAGAVAAIENIRNPARVALEVLKRTDHVLLVGDGARSFALAHGFTEQNLLTEESRNAWLKWKRNLSGHDDLLDDEQMFDIPHTDGTIHCAALDADGDLAACTTTSGLSYKLPGRVGDSPIVGAGMFVENAIGAAGATGRGEAVMQSCGAFQIVQHMASGDHPTNACLKVLKWIVDHTRRRDLLDDKGRPNFDVKMYALRKDGLYGSASIYEGGKFAVHNGAEARTEDGAFLFEQIRSKPLSRTGAAKG